MSDKCLVRHKSRMSDFRACLTDCLIINDLPKSKSDMSDFLVRLLLRQKSKQYQISSSSNKSNNEPPHTTYGRAGLRAGPPIRDVRARGPPSHLVSAPPDHDGQNDRR